MRQSQTTALMEALEKPDFAENAPEALKDLRPGLKSIGLLNAAGKALKDKKPEEAAALFKTVAEDSSTPGDLADFALIMEMRLAKPAEQAAFLPKLEKIAGSSSSPWRFHAATEAAVLKASAQDYQGARALLLPMLNAEADILASLPPSLMTRARALDHVYTLKAGTAAEKAKPAEQG
ncbi:MAG: hypothetical protein LRY54_01760 [Alphaproteobacteria bacterium]|nr:hypothetical protein [Alphaproteobacteria bacterium]